MATTKIQTFQDNPLTFGVYLTDNDDRLDCAWFNPVIENKIGNLRKNNKEDRKLVRLEVVADVNGGKRLPKGTVIFESEANNVPYVRATDIKNQRINVNRAIRIPKEVHKVIQNYQIKKDDIAITIVGTIGEIGILDEKVEICDFTENIARVRVNKDSVLVRFILHFLSSEFGRIQTERFTVGSLQYKLSLASCRNIEIYIPHDGNDYDTNAQQRILDETYEHFKKAEQKRAKGLELIKRANSVVVDTLKIPLPKEKSEVVFTGEIGVEQSSRLDALFNNPFRENLIVNLKKYPHKELGILTKPQDKKDINPADFYRLVELEQIDEKTGSIISAQEVAKLGSEKILLKTNSILIAKLQPEKGKVVIVPNEYDGAVGSSELVPILLESADVSLKYLWAILRSDYVLKQWAYELTGSSRMRIGKTELKRTIIPIPSRRIQDKITTSIDKMIAKSDNLLREADKLFQEAEHYFISAVID